MIVIDRGAYVRSEELKVSPLSEAFLYGRMSFTTLLGYNGRFFALDLHIQRLQQMCTLEGLQWNWDLDKLAKELSDLCLRNQLKSWVRARILIWKEEGLRFVVEVAGLDRSGIESKKECGVELGLCRSELPGDPWGFAQVKGYGYAHKIQALKAGLEDSLWINEKGELGECGSCSLFYFKEGVCYFNSRPGLLPSITLAKLKQSLEGIGVQVREVEFVAQDLLQAQSVWVASSLRWCLPVVNIVGLGALAQSENQAQWIRTIEAQWQAQIGVLRTY